MIADPRAPRTRCPLLVLALVAVACSQEPRDPELTVSPSTLTVVIGGAPQAFTASLGNASGTIGWTLSPAVGTLDTTTGTTVSYSPPATLCEEARVTLTASAAGLSASATITVRPTPPDLDGHALVLVDERLYSRLQPEIDDYLTRAAARRGFTIDLDVMNGLDDCGHEAVRNRLRAAKEANTALEGVLVIGNVKLPSFFQSRADNTDVRLVPRYLEDLDGVFEKRLADGSTEPDCASSSTPPCHEGGAVNVPAHDLDFTEEGSSAGPELWAAFMPVGVSGTGNTYDDFADQLRPFLVKVSSYYQGSIQMVGAYYCVSNDHEKCLGRDEDPLNWDTFGPWAIDYYGRAGPAGETGATCVGGAGNLCYRRWPLETYADHAAFLAAFSFPGEGWQDGARFALDLAATTYPIVETSVHSNSTFSMVNVAQARAIAGGGLITALHGCDVAAMQQPGSPSPTDGMAVLPSDNILMAFLYGASRAIAGMGDPFTRAHYAHTPTVWRHLVTHGDYLGNAHLERMKVKYEAAGADPWQLREWGMELLVGDPFLDVSLRSEVLDLPATGAALETAGGYAAGAEYRVRAWGTYRWGMCDPTSCPGSVACGLQRFGDPLWQTDDCWATASSDAGYISLYVNGAQPGWGAYSDDHTYALDLAGADAPFTFTLHDCDTCYGDNSGALRAAVLSVGD